MDHVIPEPGSSLMEAYEQWKQWADEKASCDYSLHVDITHWNDSIKQEVDTLIKEKGRFLQHFVQFSISLLRTEKSVYKARQLFIVEVWVVGEV